MADAFIAPRIILVHDSLPTCMSVTSKGHGPTCIGLQLLSPVVSYVGSAPEAGPSCASRLKKVTRIYNAPLNKNNRDD